MPRSALIVEDDAGWVETLADEVRKCGVAADIAQSRLVALRKLQEGHFGLVTLDPYLPPNGLVDGLAVLDHIGGMREDAPRVLVVSGYDPLPELAEHLVKYMPLVDEYFRKEAFDRTLFTAAVARVSSGRQDIVVPPSHLLIVDVIRQAITSVSPTGSSTVPVPAEIVGGLEQIKRFVERHPYDRNVFVMMKYREANLRHREIICDALRHCGFHPVLADSNWIRRDLYNAIACLLCCRLGIALFDTPEAGQMVNPNVMYELGMMHVLGRDIVLLKSDRVELPSDISPRLYLPYEDAHPEQIAGLLEKCLSSL